MSVCYIACELWDVCIVMRLSLMVLSLILLIYDNKKRFHSYFITTILKLPRFLNLAYLCVSDLTHFGAIRKRSELLFS